MVDFVGRYERLPEDFSIVARRLGSVARLSAHNSSDHAPFASYYTPELASIVARTYARDVQAFGYQPPAVTESFRA
jgi:hypothetical protein